MTYQVPVSGSDVMNQESSITYQVPVFDITC